MTHNPEHTSDHSPNRSFPTLPIIRVDQAPRNTRQKYGGLFFLGIGGLVVLAALLAWFARGAWVMREVWTAIYVLHDTSRPDAERIAAAYRLSHDPRVNQRQLWDMCLRRNLPDLARYILAEGLTAEAVADDPRGYGLAVARSEGWPNWLRLLLTRPMAYASAQGKPVPRESLLELSQNSDNAIALWARFALAASRDSDAVATSALRREAEADGPDRELARLLLAALRANTPVRPVLLDQATVWLRTNHPEAARLWKGWTVRDGRLIRDASSAAAAPS